jgi:hypothetical protein
MMDVSIIASDYRASGAYAPYRLDPSEHLSPLGRRCGRADETRDDYP